MQVDDGNPIKKARVAAGLDQIELVQRIRAQGNAISLSTLRLAERGECSARTRRLVAVALGISSEQLRARSRRSAEAA